MRKLLRSQRGAIPVGIAILLLVTSLLGLAAGYKAVQTPTQTKSQAADKCTAITAVTGPNSAKGLDDNFNCLITVSGSYRRSYVCLFQKADDPGGWPQLLCDNESVNASNWTGPSEGPATVTIPCNFNKNANAFSKDYLKTGAQIKLVALNKECVPSGNPANTLGIAWSAPFQLGSGSAPPTTPPATQPPAGTATAAPPPGTPPGNCMYITVELNYVAGDQYGSKSFDNWVTFYMMPGKQQGAQIELFRDGVFLARQRPWTPPFTFFPGAYGPGYSRIPAGQPVTFKGWTESCGGTGTTTDTVTCQTNADGTFPQDSRCKQRPGVGPPPAAATATTAPAPSGATTSPGLTCPENSCAGCILKSFKDKGQLETFLSVFPDSQWPKNNCTQLTNIVDQWCKWPGGVSAIAKTECDTLKKNQCKTSCTASEPSVSPTATSTPIPVPTATSTPIPTSIPGMGTIIGKITIKGTVPTGENFRIGFLDKNTVIYEQNLEVNKTTDYFFNNLSPGPWKTHLDWVGGDKLTKLYNLQQIQIETICNRIPQDNTECNFTVRQGETVDGPSYNINILVPTPTPPRGSQEIASGQGQESFLQNVGYTVVNAASRFIPGLQSLQPQEVQVAPTSIMGNVKINNTAGVTIDSVFVLLHKDKLDLSPLKANAISGTYTFDNLENKNYIVKAWIRDTQGRFFQNRPCTATGDDYDCTVKPGQTKNLVVDIGPQGPRAVIIKTQQFSQETLANLQKLVYNFPVLGPIIQMFVISAF